MDGYFKTQEGLEYFCGLVISDGHMSRNTRNRGSVSIELKDTDAVLLERLQKEITVNSTIRERTRQSNFSDSFTSKTLGVFTKEFRDYIEELGVPYGKKTDVKVPLWARTNVNFWRGMVDGDGSIGMTGNGFPFISFVTKSEDVAVHFAALITKTGRSVKIQRNKRDSVFNFCVFKEDAQKIVQWLGYSSDLSLDRKREKAKEVLAWKRPEGMRKASRHKKWTAEHDEYILKHSIQESVEKLGRTKQSIGMRLWRLRNR